jgi:Ca2+-binding RTX toxin-like protein
MRKNFIQKLARGLVRRLRPLSPAAKARHRRLFLEQLEGRRVMAVTASVTSGVLSVVGTTGDDSIVVDIDSGNVRVRDHGIDVSISGAHTAGDVNSAYITADNGNDIVTIDSSFGARSAWIFGQAGNDVLTGGSGDDHLDGGSGNDAMPGNSGNDYLVADASDGSSGLTGGAGSDWLDFTSESANISFTNDTTKAFEVILGGSGNDTLSNGSVSAAVSIWGFGGNDTISGGSGNDHLIGGDGNDTITGGDGNDTLAGNSGNDSLAGNGGDDYMGADESDVSSQLVGGAGYDILDFQAATSGVSFTNTTTTAFEVIYGSSYNDTLSNGSVAASVFIVGFGGNDTLTGGSGADTLNGGDGDDTLTGGTGADAFDGGNGTDSVTDFNSGEGDWQVNIP